MIDYSTQIYDATQEFLSLGDNEQRLNEPKPAHKFQSLCKYIYQKVFAPPLIPEHPTGATGRLTILDLSDTETINGIWSIYSSLCGQYNVAPTLLRFAILTGIGKDSLAHWSGGHSRTPEHQRMVRSWKQENEAYLYDSVCEGNNIGAIFLLKSDFLYRDNSTIEIKGQEKIQNVIPAERIAEKYRNIQKPEIPKFEREDEKA